MPEPVFSGDFVNNEWVFPEVDLQDLFLLSTGIQNPNINTSPDGMLCYETRSNIIWPSNDFTSSRWTKANSSVAANAALAPDGTMTATRLSDNGSSGYHGVYMPLSVTTGRMYVARVKVKAGTRSKGRIWYVNGIGVNGGWADFDLSAGTITKSAMMAYCLMEEIGDGWFDIILIGACGSASTGYFQLDVANAAGANTYVGDGTGNLYIWQADLQRGSTIGPFLPTTTGIATRPADSYVRSMPAVTAMTKVIKARTARTLPPGVEAQVLWHVDNNSETNDLEAWRDWNGHIIAEIHQGDVSRAKIDLGFVPNDTDFKIAISASAATGLIASMNGEPAITLPALPWPTGMISEKLGTNAWMMNPPSGNLTRYWGSTIAFEETYAEALTGPELEVLSAL
jgi:hypothetical protein